MKKKWMIVLAIVLAAALLFWLTVKLLQHFSVNFIAPIPAARSGTVRVACIGDSTTYGMLIWNRENNNYPAQLQALLGDDYSVRDYAANSTTVLVTGDHPYTQHNVFQLSTEFEPEIVLIMLGTNDAKPENWTSKEAFRTDYRALVSHYASLESAPEIYLMTPPAVISQGDKVGYDIDPVVLADICEIVRETAEEMGMNLIDIHAETAGREDLFSGIDGVHPNKEGAAFIAQQVYASLGLNLL